MKVSLNTIKQYTDIDLSVDELVAKINAQLGGVEGGKDGVTDLGKRYERAVIAKVVTCDDHPNADRLHVCKVDDGGVVEGVERDENGLVQVVCGAPNVHADMFVVWLPPKSTVPASFDEKELFVLDTRDLRGVASNGMLASAKELGIGDSHDGILEIDPDEWKPSDEEIKPGASFAKVYGLDDIIIDIENKMFTHRPDLFGQLGVAREIAGIQHKSFVSPDWYRSTPEFNDASGLEISVFNETPENVPRFMAVTIKDIEVKPSPLWLQIELVRLGSKPINNVVDATNYVMLLTAQPTHAYDYDKLRGNRLGARMAQFGETVKLLNGKEYTLDESDIVIADAEGPVGLAGIMGGGESEVSAETTNIVLEVANFDMYTVRKSAMRHGVFTDALTRFNKGQSPLQNPVVLKHLMKYIIDIAGGEQASEVFDLSVNIEDNKNIVISHDFIASRLGKLQVSVNNPLSEDSINQLLKNVEFDVKILENSEESKRATLGTHHIEVIEKSSDQFSIKAPFWRTDIELPEDIVEEVGRLYGYDRLPRELPKRTTKPTPQNHSRELVKDVRDRLSRAGANEVLTYSFVHEKVLKNAGQDVVHAYRLSNALSPDLQYYRLSLIPSLLDKVHANQRAGYEQFALFEINKVHFKGEMDEHEPDVPNEDRHVALTVAYADKHKPGGSPYYYAKRYLEQITDVTGLRLVLLSEFDRSTDERGAQLTAPFEPNRSAVIVRDGQVWGVVGEYRTSVKRAFKLPEFSAGFEIHEGVLKRAAITYTPLSKYPSTDRDICFKVSKDVAYRQIVDLAEKGLEDTAVDSKILPLDLYQGEGESTKNITIRVTLTPHDKTLGSSEANQIIDHLIKSVVDGIGAEVV